MIFGGRNDDDEHDHQRPIRIDVQLHNDGDLVEKVEKLIAAVRRMTAEIERLTAAMGQVDIPEKLADDLEASNTALDKAVSDNTPAP